MYKGIVDLRGARFILIVFLRCSRALIKFDYIGAFNSLSSISLTRSVSSDNLNFQRISSSSSWLPVPPLKIV